MLIAVLRSEEKKATNGRLINTLRRGCMRRRMFDQGSVKLLF